MKNKSIYFYIYKHLDFIMKFYKVLDDDKKVDKYAYEAAEIWEKLSEEEKDLIMSPDME